ncbi:MAG: LLM class flavin-dependent oxidoreductase [Acidimicrobiia bacterium]|nr:LLM class flavin-dependent oxidoreductase [Acidimicrobiia bacterium]
MKIGLKLNTQFRPGQDPVEGTAELVEQVRLARDCGFDSVWVSQHYLTTPFQALQTWPMLGRIAAEAGEMQIGSAIYLLTLHNPVEAAELATTIDVLTGGRFIFGVGLGYREQEFEAFGLDIKQRVSRFTEALEVLLRLWTEESVTHQGKHFQLTDAHLTMRPVQQPHPPIWIAASSDVAVKRIAKHGFPWLINPHASLTTVEKQMGLFHESLDEHGKARPSTVPVFKEFSIAQRREDALATARPYLEKKYQSYADWGLDKPMPEGERLTVPLDELAKDRFIIGTPEECREELLRHEEAIGADHFLLRMQWPGMPQGDVLRQLELAGEELIPKTHGLRS